MLSSSDHPLVSTRRKRERERNQKLKIMAEAAVSLVVEHLIPFLKEEAKLLKEEAKLLKEVRGEVEFIIDEMDSIRGVLKDADARAEIEEDVKVWVKQLRQVAFRMEDVLDEFRLRVAQQEPRRSGGVLSWVRQTFGCVKRLKSRHVVATDIQDIKGKLIQISERKDRYKFNQFTPESEKAGSSNSNSNEEWKFHQDDALYVEDSELVGIKEQKDQLISWLVEGEERRSVFAVVGTGGVGKSTLVRKAYESDQVKSKFYCYAWITVSQSFKIEELLKKLIMQFQESMKDSIFPPLDEKLERTQLIDKLRSYLKGKRYVVVVDDVWSVELWTSLKNALLDNHCHSRIIVTTRDNGVADSFVDSPSHVCNLSPLPLEDGLNLFYKKAFGSDFKGQCPPDLEDLSKKIVMRSGGLPLGIVVMGGLLLTKEKTFLEWKKFHDSLSSNLGEDPNLRSIMKIISLSYQDLPYHLKSCFLYFGLFPEDYEIFDFKLTNLWIAEGFVKEKMGKTLEEVADDYLDQLVRRNLVQAYPSRIFYNVKSYRVHDLMHEFILSRSLEEDFCEVLGGKASASSIVNSRRLSIQSIPSRDDILKNTSTPCVTRSLFVFQLDELPNSMMHTFLSSFVLLKVLSLGRGPLEDFPDEVTKLLQLRYLDICGTRIKALPDGIANLQNLETLYLEVTDVNLLPLAILKLRKLRHLKADLMVIPERIGLLTNLQSLKVVDASQGTKVITELGKLTQLTSLYIANLRRENGVNLCACIDKWPHLRKLFIWALKKDEFLQLQFVSSPPSLLQCLHLIGRLEKLPDWVLSLKNLNEIGLIFSRLTEDLLKAFHTLPNLEQIVLNDNAYVGEELHFQADSFQKLKRFFLRGLEMLHSLVIQKGALPNLQEMTIADCQQLREMPTGIADLKKLKTLSFYNMPTGFTSKLAQDGGEDYWKVKHVPRVQFVCPGEED